MNDLLKWLLDPKGKSVVSYRIALIALIVWNTFSRDYVTKAAYTEDKKAQLAINAAQISVNTSVSDTLTKINTTLAVMGSQDERLRDHESRIRELEKRNHFRGN